MPYMMVRNRVQDYGAWRRVFDEHASVRGERGSKGARVFRDASDPNQVVVILEWDDLDSGRRFGQSDTLREAMQQAGVIDQPDVYFLEEAEPSSA